MRPRNSALGERERLRKKARERIAAIDAELRRAGKAESADTMVPIFRQFVEWLLA